MKEIIRSAIGSLMAKYRNSRFHNALIGKWLAKLLDIVLASNNKQVICMIGGINFNLDLNEVIDASLYYSGTFEPKIEVIMEKVLIPGMTVLDIGANIGYYTFRMAKRIQPEGKVYAIEPTTWAYTKLLQNGALNPHINNVEFVKIGLSDLDLGNSQIAFQSSYRLDGKDRLITEEIKLLKLDTFVSECNIKHIDFIKIDVDGFEDKIIAGASETLSRFKPILIMELNPIQLMLNKHNPLIINDMIKQLNYTLYDEDENLIPNLKEYLLEYQDGSSTMVLAIQKN